MRKIFTSLLQKVTLCIKPVFLFQQKIRFLLRKLQFFNFLNWFPLDVPIESFPKFLFTNFNQCQN
jgi:hypothetical protein